MLCRSSGLGPGSGIPPFPDCTTAAIPLGVAMSLLITARPVRERAALPLLCALAGRSSTYGQSSSRNTFSVSTSGQANRAVPGGCPGMAPP